MFTDMLGRGGFPQYTPQQTEQHWQQMKQNMGGTNMGGGVNASVWGNDQPPPVPFGQTDARWKQGRAEWEQRHPNWWQEQTGGKFGPYPGSQPPQSGGGIFGNRGGTASGGGGFAMGDNPQNLNMDMFKRGWGGGQQGVAPTGSALQQMMQRFGRAGLGGNRGMGPGGFQNNQGQPLSDIGQGQVPPWLRRNDAATTGPGWNRRGDSQNMDNPNWRPGGGTGIFAGRGTPPPAGYDPNNRGWQEMPGGGYYNNTMPGVNAPIQPPPTGYEWYQPPMPDYGGGAGPAVMPQRRLRGAGGGADAPYDVYKQWNERQYGPSPPPGGNMPPVRGSAGLPTRGGGFPNPSQQMPTGPSKGGMVPWGQSNLPGNQKMFEVAQGRMTPETPTNIPLNQGARPPRQRQPGEQQYGDPIFDKDGNVIGSVGGGFAGRGPGSSEPMPPGARVGRWGEGGYKNPGPYDRSKLFPRSPRSNRPGGKYEGPDSEGNKFRNRGGTARGVGPSMDMRNRFFQRERQGPRARF